jgi:hypothetical protein
MIYLPLQHLLNGTGNYFSETGNSCVGTGTIETMFINLKTKGFALEATHLIDPDKLGTLLALLAFAVALTVKTGVARTRLHDIPIKKHGRRAWSLFALGLNTLRKIFIAASPDQIIAFLDQLLSPKLPVKPLRALAFR